jgi:hypothetical protein
MNQVSIGPIEMNDSVSKGSLSGMMGFRFSNDGEINEGPRGAHFHPFRGRSKAVKAELSGRNEDPGALGTAPPEDSSAVPEFDEWPLPRN